jgi:hypothetical protein
MIHAPCPCGFVMHTPEVGTNRLTPCPSCGRPLVFASASKLPANVGSSDFGCFAVVEESDGAARTYLLGGTADIAIGDSPDCLIRLINDRGDGRLGVLRPSAPQSSHWQIIPARYEGASLGSGPMRPAELAHGDVISWPRVRVRYYTHPLPQRSAALANALALPAIPVGPAVLAGIAFLFAVGAGVIRNVLPVSSRDVRILLTLAMVFILAPSLWIAALVWGLTRLRTLHACLVWVAILIFLALFALLARASMGIL